jgi:hypothetical protein
MRKSLPQAVAFTKGTVAISVALDSYILEYGHDELAVNLPTAARIVAKPKRLGC